LPCDVAEQINPVVGFVGDERVMTWLKNVREEGMVARWRQHAAAG